MQNTRLQVDVYSRSMQEADAISTACDAAFAAWGLWQNLPISQQDLYEDAVKAYRIVREYSIWSTN
jgi:alanine-alpha-ketoisovalerate/valine-pyruvate aminotransferase